MIWEPWEYKQKIFPKITDKNANKQKVMTAINR